MNASYSFIENVNDFFSTGYFTEDFHKKVFDKSGYSNDGIKELCSKFSSLRQQYNRYKQEVTSRYAREKDKEKFTHDFNTLVLTCLGYYGTDKEQPDTVLSLPLAENGGMKEFAVRTVCSRTDGSPQLYVMDIETLVTSDNESERGFAELDLDRMVTHIFSLPEREHPRYILLLSGNKVFFMDADKWERGAYLMFDIERLLVETTQTSMRNYFALFYLLVSREALAALGETPLMQQLEEESYKNAYAVTQDLKKGVVNAVESLANEAIWYIKQDPDNQFHNQDETDDNFEAMMRDDCLVFIYRLLFIFYAESRPDLDILPINDKTYQRGYSLEMLRDLEQVNLITAESRNGYFFDSSIKKLFHLILVGNNEERRDQNSMSASFRVRHIDSPLFSDRKLKVLSGVKFRNMVWQRIICELSLSQQQNRKARGRISYANLGINQLGSVYENLLAYRGFYAEEDYIEVHPVGDEVETYLVPRSRRDDFKEEEILKDELGADIIYQKGRFIYRLNGRDRKESGSYYTPEVLTKSTIKYTLKPIIERLEKGEIKASDLLEMKILEPAMGAAAFQNEVINQLSVLYLNFRKNEAGKAIDPLEYPNELQKVKAFIATNNVYGVDLNATAIELGKLSLWLNVMHKDMETPFFSNRLAQGNAVIGAWLKVYKQSDVQREVVIKKTIDKQWWEAPTKRISFGKTSPNRHYTEVYHFLLPVKEMLGVLNTKQRERTDTAYKSMVEKRKGWLKGISASEYNQLKRISSKIDVLLKEYVEFQLGVAKYANNGYHVWEYTGNRELPFNTNAERQALDDRRYRKNSPYMKLKMVMDYWCSLFFWEFKDAADLPSRQEYWDDIERVLNVDVESEAKVKFGNADKNGQLDLFKPQQGTLVFDEQEKESEIKAKELTEILADKGGKQTTQLQLEGVTSNRRYDIVEQLANRYHFFHPMLEFLEVFWLRDGFDIICGNPPWVKWQYEPQKVVSDKYPEYIIRPEYNANNVARLLKETDFLHDENLKTVCNSSETEVECCKALFNSTILYSVLKGSQSDLFKGILRNSILMLSPSGYLGMVHPNTVFDEAKGQTFRKYLYPRLKYRFQYDNRKKLFVNVHPEMQFNTCVYSGTPSAIEFDAINNVFLPQTIDECYSHRGTDICKGVEYVDNNGKKHSNIQGHKERILHYNESILRLVAKVFENTDDWESSKMVSIHCSRSIRILEKLTHRGHLSDVTPFVTVGFDATNALKDNTIQECTKYPDYENYEMIFNSLEVNLLSPFSKLPQSICSKDGDYDGVDYTKVSFESLIRTNFIPKAKIEVFKSKIDESGKWFENYKVGFKKMLDITHERTLKGAILPPKASHTHSIISASFDGILDLVLFTGFASSLLFDFFVKTVGVGNLTSSVLKGFPYGIESKFKDAIIVRVLRMNCVNIWYKDLWRNVFNDNFISDSWCISDERLTPYSSLSYDMNSSTLFKNDFERRMSLIELDVIVAQAFGFDLNELIYIYISTFNTTQKYDADTWFDKRGRIIFTANTDNKLDLDRKTSKGNLGWEDVRGEQIDENTYAGIQSEITHVIDPKKSELYGGQTVTYYAPFNRQNRIEDYRRAWAHFEKVFNKE